MTKLTQTDRLTACVDQLQAELNDMHRELTMLGMALVGLSVLVALVAWRAK